MLPSTQIGWSVVPPGTELPLDMLPELEARIERGFASYVDMGKAFKTIQDGKLWRGEYASFADYVHHRWGLKRSSSYGYMTAADVARSLESVQDIGKLPYSKALQLVSLSDRERVEVARDHDLITMPHHEIARVVREKIADEPQRPIKGRVATPRGRASITTLEKMPLERADLLIWQQPSDPPVLAEIGLYLRPGCSFFVPFSMPHVIFADSEVEFLGIIGVVNPTPSTQERVIVQQHLFGWYSRGQYIGGDCGNRLDSFASVVKAVTWEGDTIYEIGGTTRDVLDEAILTTRNYVAINPSTTVEAGVAVYQSEG